MHPWVQNSQKMLAKSGALALELAKRKGLKEDIQMTKSSLITLAALFALLALCCSCLWARPTTADEAEKVVTGWLKADPKPLGMSLGRQVRQVETFRNESGEAIYHIVYLHPSGFVIVSADDLVEPIIGFVQGDRFDPSPDNPLGALVADDLNGRIAAVRTDTGPRVMAAESLASDARPKWRHFIDLASAPKDGVAMMALSLPSISDVRVAPLVKSRWAQSTVSTDCPLPCYNYCTPNNYPCGCPATAMAQLMRYHEYPTTGIGVDEFTITIGWISGVEQKAFTRGGDGFGGPYRWDLMPYEPNCDTTEVQRQVIGALCFDAGISMNQMYSSTASGYAGCGNARIKEALTTTFGYGNAVHGYNAESPIGRGLIGMINPNLDAKKPVVLGTAPHAFVCDGYGYDYSTLYHHLNMGWSGLSDAWYDLPTGILKQGLVCSCVYNVQTIRAGDGEIVSGRVLDQDGEPIANAVLYVKSGSEIIAETETDSEGIYAFDCLESNAPYTVNTVLKGYGFNTQKVTTGISKDNSVVSGNVWGVDFLGLLCDFNGDQIVDMRDLCTLAQYWGQDESSVDIAPGPSGDHMVDYEDLALLAGYWLKEVVKPQEPGLVAHWRLDETEGFIAHDSVGDHNGFVLVQNPLWRPTGGKIAGALELDGIDDSVSAPFVLNPAEGAFSVFAWIKGGSPGQVIISQTGGTGTGATWLGTGPSDGALMSALVSPGRFGSPLVSNAVITDGQWHHIGLVWNGSYRTLYVDEIEAAKDAQPQSQPISANGGLYIGTGKGREAGSFWSGLIDDIRIYDRAVTP